MTELLSSQYYIYILMLLAASAFAIFINRWLLNRSVSLGVRDLNTTDLVRWTSQTKPAVGGISFFILFVMSFVAACFVGGQDALFSNPAFLGFFTSVSLAFLIGLADDVKNINPMVKFLGQLFCANILYFSGIFIEISSLTEINYVMSLLWVVGVMNSINMLDNMDGISGITSIAIIVASIAVMFVSGSFSAPYLILMLGVLGAIIGFMKFNWNPAKVYMGDTGSQFVGAFLAGISMLFLWNVYQVPNESQMMRWSQFALPLVVFVLPIIDSVTVSIRRISRGQSPFVGGRDHTTHNLAVWGLKDKQVAQTFALISTVSILFGVWIFNYITEYAIFCSVLAFLYFTILFCSIQLIYNINNKRNLAKEAVKVKDNKIKKMPALQPVRSISRTRIKDKTLL